MNERMNFNDVFGWESHLSTKWLIQHTTIIITVCFIHSQTEPIDVLQVYPYTTLIIQIVYLSLILLKRGNVGCCCIEQFKSFLFISATGHQKMHLIFHQLSTQL